MATSSESELGRLLKPGSTFRNLNPFFVLQIDVVSKKLDLEEVKKKYRRLSILVHPDKNPGQVERSQMAFDAVKKAYEMLNDANSRAQCLEVLEEARGTVLKEIEEQNKSNKKKMHDVKNEESELVDRINAKMSKLFAELELKRRDREDKISAKAAKKREAELEIEERRKMEKEFNKNFEESRQNRVNSWLNFQKKGSSANSTGNRKPTDTTDDANDSNEVEEGSASCSHLTAHANHLEENVGKEKKKKKTKKFSPMGFRPPKHKPESR